MVQWSNERSPTDATIMTSSIKEKVKKRVEIIGPRLAKTERES